MHEYFSHIESLIFLEGKAEIPDFGCFTTNFIPTKVDKLSNKIIPAHSVVKFKAISISYVSNLEKRLIAINNSSPEEAKIRVKKFAYTLKKELKYGKKKIEIGSIGSLHYNIIGNIKFKHSGLNFNANTIGMNPVDFYESQSVSRKKHINKKLIVILLIIALSLIYLVIFFTKEENNPQEKIIKSDKSEFIDYDSFKDFIRRK